MTDTYVLGHSDEETRRLASQAEIYAEHTDRLLAAAGITEGMHVLDVGCGAGDVSIHLARLVGPTGSVTGVDSDAEVLATARARAAGLGLGTVRFERATLPDIDLRDTDLPDIDLPDNDLPGTAPFDAAVGRLILLHLAEPVEAIRAVAALVRPGGVVTFQDFNASRARVVPELPLLSRCVEVIRGSLRAVGRQPDTGERMPGLFRDAGLAEPRLAVSVPVADPEAAAVNLGETLLSMLPVAERAELVRPGEFDPATVVAALRAEVRATPCVVYMPELVGVWSRVTRPGG